MQLARDGRAFTTLRKLRNKVIHLRKGLNGVHPTVYVHPSALVARDLVAGEYAFVAPGCQIDPGVSLGRYVMLATGVAIVGDDHVWTKQGVPIQFSGRPAQTTTEIDADAWLGYRAVIRRGVTVGRGAIVAANAVVTRDVAPYAIVAGVPAVVIGQRFESDADRAEHDAMLSGPVLQPSFAEPLQVERDPS